LPETSVSQFIDIADRFTGGLSYTLRNWSFQYQIGYQTYNETRMLNNLISPERSINVSDPTTANGLLTSLSWSQASRLTTPIGEFSYTESRSTTWRWKGSIFTIAARAR